MESAQLLLLKPGRMYLFKEVDPVMKNIKIAVYYFAQHVKNMLMYKSDFWFILISDAIWGVAGIIMMLGIFSHIPDFKGYTFNEIIFIYGFSMMSLGIYYTFFKNIDELTTKYLYGGELDRLLVRPINPYFQVLLDKFYLDKVADLVAGFIIILVISPKVGVSWTIPNIFFFVILVIGGSMVYLGLFTLFNCVGFWATDNQGNLGPLKSLRIFSKYPTTIYNKLIKVMITWILPYAFTSFYPATYFLKDKRLGNFGLLTIVIGITHVGLGYFIWHFGLKRYNSVGN